jgi:hypothetical protein
MKVGALGQVQIGKLFCQGSIYEKNSKRVKMKKITLKLLLWRHSNPGPTLALFDLHQNNENIY